MRRVGRELGGPPFSSRRDGPPAWLPGTIDRGGGPETRLARQLSVGRNVVTAAGLVVGLEAQLACVCVGVGVGLLCSRLVIGRPGYSLVVALILVMVLPLTPGLPPVNPMLKLMSNGRPAAELVTPVTGYLAISVVLLLVAGTVTQLVAERRD